MGFIASKKAKNFQKLIENRVLLQPIEGNAEQHEKACKHQAEKLGRIEGDNPPFWRCSIAPLLENCDSELIEEDVLKDS